MKRVLTVLIALSFAASVLQAQQNKKSQQSKQSTPKPAAQTPYELKFNVKGAKDSVMYLAIYTFDKQYLVDTATRSKDGQFIFRKKRALDKGMYMLVSQGKAKLLDFVVNEGDKFSVSFDSADVVKSIKFTGTPENERFHELVKFMAAKSVELDSYKKEVKSKNTADSTKLMQEKTRGINKDVDAFRKEFLQKYPNGFVSDFVRLQMEPDVTNPPMAKYYDPANPGKVTKERPDSVWQYQHFKNTFWNNIPLGDERILHTPIFGDKLKNYFQKTLLQIPDSICKEIPKVVERTKASKEMFKWVVYWLTTWSENNKVMGFDEVFVCIVDMYYRTGQVDFYSKDQLEKIIKRADILKPLLIGQRIPELFAMDTVGTKVAMKYGLDSCKTSDCLTKNYLSNKGEIDKFLLRLSEVKAKYTILLFWDVDCGHCKKEVPVIFDEFKKLREEGIDVKVHAVYTQHEYKKWFKTLQEMKLMDPNWKNVVDAVHLQNLKDKFDIFSTPVIYLLDENQIIRYKRIGAEQVGEIIRFMNKKKEEK